MPHLNGVIFQRDKWWIAQCLEHDIGAQALTIQDAVYELQRSIVGYVLACGKHGVEPFNNLSRAPQMYWAMWEKAQITVSAKHQAFEEIPQTDLKLAA